MVEPVEALTDQRQEDGGPAQERDRAARRLIARPLDGNGMAKPSGWARASPARGPGTRPAGIDSGASNERATRLPAGVVGGERDAVRAVGGPPSRSSSQAVQVVRTVEPAPSLTRIVDPGTPPLSRATAIRQRLAPPAVVIDTATRSRVPSPVGENSVGDADAARMVGGIVSTVTTWPIWAGVTGRDEGARYVTLPAVPTSCRTCRLSGRTVEPPRVPSQSQVRVPDAAGHGTAADERTVDPESPGASGCEGRYRFVQRERSRSSEPSASSRRAGHRAPRSIRRSGRSRRRSPCRRCRHRRWWRWAPTWVRSGPASRSLQVYQTPLSTNDTGPHSWIGWLTSNQV